MPIKSDREYRDFQLAIKEVEDGPMTVTGYATVFDTPYTLMEGEDYRMQEVVDPGVFEDANMADVIFQYNHEGRVFARQKNGTLRLSVDERGLLVEADLSGTEMGRNLYEEIKGGYTDKMSFGFTIAKDKWEESKTEDGRDLYTRRLLKIRKVYDVSAVSIPANDATSISVRSLTDGVIERIRQERLEAEQMELERIRLQLRARLMR